ncbi:hypothetical protein Lepto7375DRAFT_1734 [Leptolyngbya sp. PCC 7375]|nr:hypothetical protein Lepto7375DRAFT_1734 [Leptolyngbya sp. PCC 7375]
MPLKDSLKVGPWSGGAPFLSEIEGKQAMSDTTTQPTLTPARLREALERWANEQPDVILYRASPLNTYAVSMKYIGTSVDESISHHLYVAEFIDETLVLFSCDSIMVLTLTAIEHQYRPWLRLVAGLDCSGAKAARMALGAMAEAEALTETVGRAARELAGRVKIEGVGEKL